MSSRVQPIGMDVHLPPGIAGPEPLDFDVRCFLVAHASGVVLIDVGLAGSQDAVRAGLERVGAGWGDITDVVLTHGHEDHVGGLADVIANEEEAILFAGDIVGSMAGRLTRGPAPFIAHPEEAERSLRRVAGLEFDRVLFGHGAEIQDPVHELRSLLGAE